MGEVFKVFISATSGDLGTVREIVKQGLLTMRCLPVEQTNFTPDHRTVAEMLEARIRECEAVIHLVGLRYGAAPDPATLPPGAPRRSFTQMEADIARQLGRKLYVFLCPENFPFDACAPEPAELAELQRAYRAEIADRSALHTQVNDRHAVAERIRELQLDLEKMRDRLVRHRRRVLIAGTLVALLLAGLALGVWWNVRRTPALIAARVQEAAAYDPARIRANLERQIQQRAQEEIGKLDKVRDWEKVGKLEALRDQQMADVDHFLEQMGQAFDKKEASETYVIASRLLAESGVPEALRFLQSKETSRDARIALLNRNRETQEEALRELLREKMLTASLFEKNGRSDEAEAEYRAAVKDAGGWGEPRNQLSKMLTLLGKSMDPAEGNRKLQEAAELSRGTLASTTREADPLSWAGAQSTLGGALREQGIRAAGDEGTQLLTQAVAAYRACLEVRTREQLPEAWAFTCNNISYALRELALRQRGDESRRTLEEAANFARGALEVRTREQSPQAWAMTENNLANILTAQGERSTGEESRRLTAEAVVAYRAALEAVSREQFPGGWSMIQNNLGNALRNQSRKASGDESLQLMREAAAAYRAALELRTRDRAPQDWAQTENNLANLLRDQGTRTAGAGGTRLLTEAVATYHAALEVRTKAQLPQDWARTEHNLVPALRELARRTPGPEGDQLKAEADQIDRELPR